MGWLGTALSYFTGGLAGAYNSYMQNDSISNQIAAQAEENQKNRDFSKQMYEQQWADYMKNYPEIMQMENDAQFNLWKNQFATQAAYNSENAQVARSLVAGLNPSKNGLIQGSNMNMQPSTVQPPPHIQGSPLGGSISPTGIPDLLPNNLLAQAASFAKDMSQVDVNKSLVEKMSSEVEKILAEKDLIDSERSFKEIRNGIYQVLGYKKETVEIINKVKQAYMFEAEGDSASAAAKMHEAQKDLFDSEKALNDEKKPFVGKIMQSEIDRNQSEVRRNNAQAFEAGERAHNLHEQTETIKQLRPYQVDFEKYRSQAQKYISDSAFWQSLIQHDSAVVSSATKTERIKYAIEEAENKGLVNRQLGYAIENAMASAEWAEVRELLGVIETGASIGTNVARAKSLGDFATQQEIHNQINAEYFRYKMMPKKHESYQDRYDADGNHLGSTVTRRYDE